MIKKYSVAIGLILLLAGCLVPEKFAAEINFFADASYTFKYKGITAYTAADYKNAERNKSLYQADADRLLKRPEFKKVEYLNNGRYDITIEYHKRAGESLKMFDVFSVSTDKDNVITITSKAINDGERRRLEKMGVEVKGTLSVSLPANAKIMAHNATSTPYFFGLLGSYSWQIEGFDERPMLQFKMIV